VTQRQAAAIAGAIKGILKARGLRYADLAGHLGVSLATVKRDLASGDVSLQRLLSICDWLGLSLEDVVLTSVRSEPEGSALDEEQIELFAEFPALFSLTVKLARGASPKEVQRAEGISDAEMRSHLVALENARVLERLPGDKVRLKLRSPLTWPQESRLGRKLALDLFLDFSNHVGRSYLAKGTARLDVLVHSLTSEDAKELEESFQRIAADFRKRSHYNTKVFPKGKLLRVTCSLAMDEYEAPFLRGLAEP
jgi:transcriptional regulator with XRE-family HTH domain